MGSAEHVDRRPAFDGSVLCGGSSRRMGRDKALIVVDGAPMYRRVLEALSEAGASAVAAVGGDAERLTGMLSLPDRWPGQGPLGGIVTALTDVGSAPAVAVLSCDLLHPDADAIRALVTAREDTDRDVAVAVSDGRAQWTHAVWHRRVLERLEAQFMAGTRAVHAAVDGFTVARVAMPAEATADADRPEDLG